MILGTTLLHNAINKENYDNKNQEQRRAYSGNLIVAFVIVIIELSVLYFAIDIAMSVSNSRAEKFVNLVLAVTLTLPYLMLNVLFNEKARARLATY